MGYSDDTWLSKTTSPSVSATELDKTMNSRLIDSYIMSCLVMNTTCLNLQCINAEHRQQCCSQRAESMVLVLVLVLMPMVWAQPYPIPPTCYTKVLNMGKEITQKAEDIKKDHEIVSLTHPIEVSTTMS